MTVVSSAANRGHHSFLGSWGNSSQGLMIEQMRLNNEKCCFCVLPGHIVKRFASAEQLKGARCKNKKIEKVRGRCRAPAACCCKSRSHFMPVECLWPLKIFPLPQHWLFSASAHSALSTLSSEPSSPPPLHSRTTGASSHFPPLPQLMTSS